MLPPNSVILKLSLTWNRKHVFPNLSSVSNKLQSSAKIQPDKLISSFPSDSLSPVLAPVQKKSKVEETLFMYIQEIKSI